MTETTFSNHSESIGSEALRRSFSISAKVSLVLFATLSIFLFLIQINQQHQIVEKKLSIDSELVVNAVKLGDLFFITKYLAAFVDSGVVKHCGIKKYGEDSWLGLAPDNKESASLREGGFSLKLHSTTIYRSMPMMDHAGSLWNFYYSYDVPHFFLGYAAMISLAISFIIFFFLNKVLKQTAGFFSEPVKNLNKDLDAHLGNLMGAFEPFNYRKGKQFRETDRFVEELNRLLSEIKIQNGQIKEAEIHKALSRLGRQVNHDIQSPLGALSAALEQIDINKSAALGLMKRSTRRIQEIVSDLKISELEMANMRPVFERLELNTFLRNMISEKEAEYGGAVKFNFLSSGFGIHLLIDKAGISRVISNIINNGIEAVENHEPQIEVQIIDEPQKIKIMFADNGPGVPREIKNKAFEYGYSFGKKGGAGTGLSHAVSVMELHNGQVVIDEDENGKFNVFTLIFNKVSKER